LMLLRMVAAELSWGRHDHPQEIGVVCPENIGFNESSGFLSHFCLGVDGSKLISKICTQYFRCMLTWPKSCGSQGRTVDLKKNSFHVNSSRLLCVDEHHSFVGVQQTRHI
jgi:hypothetical protein